MKLKTLNDIFEKHDREIAGGDYWMRAFLTFNTDIRQEAIKWWREKEEINFETWEDFFNITEEDLMTNEELNAEEHGEIGNN